MDDLPPVPPDGGNVLSDFLAVLPLEGIGVVGVLLGFAVLVAKGVIVIGSSHRELMDEKDKRNTRTEVLLDKALETISSQQKTIDKQTVISDVTAHVFEDLRKSKAHQDES